MPYYVYDQKTEDKMKSDTDFLSYIEQQEVTFFDVFIRKDLLPIRDVINIFYPIRRLSNYDGNPIWINPFKNTEASHRRKSLCAILQDFVKEKRLFVAGNTDDFFLTKINPEIVCKLLVKHNILPLELKYLLSFQKLSEKVDLEKLRILNELAEKNVGMTLNDAVSLVTTLPYSTESDLDHSSDPYLPYRLRFHSFRELDIPHSPIGAIGKKEVPQYEREKRERWNQVKEQALQWIALDKVKADRTTKSTNMLVDVKSFKDFYEEHFLGKRQPIAIKKILNKELIDMEIQYKHGDKMKLFSKAIKAIFIAIKKLDPEFDELKMPGTVENFHSFCKKLSDIFEMEIKIFYNYCKGKKIPGLTGPLCSWGRNPKTSKYWEKIIKLE